MEVQALGMLSNITAIVQKQHVNTIESDINVEKDFYGTLREQQINCVKEDIYNKFHIDVGAANVQMAILSATFQVMCCTE